MDTTDTDGLDQADMERLVAGQDAALNALMQRHGPGIFGFLYRMLGHEDDANDLAQETFVRVFRARQSYQPGRKFSTWLFTIAANLARNHLRWRSRHPNVSLDAESETTEQTLGDSLPTGAASPDEAAETAERANLVRRTVQRLPEDMREVLVLCEWEDRSVVEAAAILNISPKAAESRLYRARQLLRERLAKWL
jgi:RNA polymerase sigma-70 factor (ECF subfamily)